MKNLFRRISKKTVAVLLALALIISCLTVSFSTFAETAAFKITAASPLLPLKVDKAVNLNSLSVEVGGIFKAGNSLSWLLLSGTAAEKTDKQIVGKEVGLAKFSVSDGANALTVWVKVNAADDNDFSLINLDFSKEGSFISDDWMQGILTGTDVNSEFSGKDVSNKSLMLARSGRYKLASEGFLSRVTVATANGNVGALKIPASADNDTSKIAVFKSPMMDSFKDYSITAKMISKLTGDSDVCMISAPGIMARVSADYNASASQYILTETKSLAFRFRNFGALSLYGLATYDDKYNNGAGNYISAPLLREGDHSYYTGTQAQAADFQKDTAVAGKVFAPAKKTDATLGSHTVNIELTDPGIKYSLNGNVIFDTTVANTTFRAMQLTFGEAYACPTDRTVPGTGFTNYFSAEGQYMKMLCGLKENAKYGTVGIMNNYGADLYVYSIKVTAANLKNGEMPEFVAVSGGSSEDPGEENTFYVNADSPLIPLKKGKAVSLSKLMFTFGVDSIPGNAVSWQRVSGSSAKVAAGQIAGLGLGYTNFKITYNSITQSVWVKVNAADDDDYSIVNLDFSKDGSFNADDWMQGYNISNSTGPAGDEAVAGSGKYTLLAAGVLSLQTVTTAEGQTKALYFPAASAHGEAYAAIYKSKMLDDFGVYDITAKVSNKQILSQYTNTPSAAPGILARVNANYDAQVNKYIFTTTKSMAFRFRNYGGLGFFGLTTYDLDKNYDPLWINKALWKNGGLYTFFTAGTATDYYHEKLADNAACQKYTPENPKSLFPDPASATTLTVKTIELSLGANKAVKYALNGNVVFDCGPGKQSFSGMPMSYGDGDWTTALGTTDSTSAYDTVYYQNIEGKDANGAKKGTVGLLNNYGNDYYIYSLKVTVPTINEANMPTFVDIKESGNSNGLPINTRYDLTNDFGENSVIADTRNANYEIRDRKLLVYSMPATSSITVNGTSAGAEKSFTYNVLEAGSDSDFGVETFADKNMTVIPVLTSANTYKVKISTSAEVKHGTLILTEGTEKTTITEGEEGSANGSEFVFTTFSANKMVLSAEYADSVDEGITATYCLGSTIRLPGGGQNEAVRFLMRIPAIRNNGKAEDYKDVAIYGDTLSIGDEEFTVLNVGALMIPEPLLGGKDLKLPDGLTNFDPTAKGTVLVNGYFAQNVPIVKLVTATDRYSDAYITLTNFDDEGFEIEPLNVPIAAVTYVQYKDKAGNLYYAYSKKEAVSYNEIYNKSYFFSPTNTVLDSVISGGTNHDLDSDYTTDDLSYEIGEEISFNYNIKGAYALSWQLRKDDPVNNLYGTEQYTTNTAKIVAQGVTKSGQGKFTLTTKMKTAGTLKLVATLVDAAGNTVKYCNGSKDAMFITTVAVDYKNIKQSLETGSGKPTSYKNSSGATVTMDTNEFINSLRTAADSRVSTVNAALETNKSSIKSFISSATSGSSQTFGGVLKLTCYTVANGNRYFDFAIATNDTVGLTTTNATTGLFTDTCYATAASSTGMPEYNLRPATGYFSIPSTTSTLTTVSGTYQGYGPNTAARGTRNEGAIMVNMNSHGYDNTKAYNSAYISAISAKTADVWNGGIYNCLFSENEKKITDPNQTYAYGVVYRDYLALQVGKKLFNILTERKPDAVTTSGGSFGGWQSVMVSALDKDVTKTVGDVVWMSSLGWENSPDMNSTYHPDCAGNNSYGLRYFSSVSAAQYISATMNDRPKGYNIVLTGGWADSTSPARGLIAIYNAFASANCNKSLTLYQNKSHGATPTDYAFTRETVYQANVCDVYKETPVGPTSPTLTSVVPGGAVLRNRAAFQKPGNLITTAQYQTEMNNLLSIQDNYTAATNDTLKKIDELDLKLQDAIVYNTDDITTCSGTRFYVAADGNDSNDGKSPEKAWKTIKKVNNAQTAGTVKSGDLVSFKRGDMFRGIVQPKSGVTYSAYGTGYKPQICSAFDAKQWEWVSTEKKNVWKLNHKFAYDAGSNYGLNFTKELDVTLALSVNVMVSPDGSERAGIWCEWLSDVDKNFEFVYTGPAYNKRSQNKDASEPISVATGDRYLYMYCDLGNPGDLFTDIEIGYNTSVFNENNVYIENVHVNNLELLYGRGPFWPGNCENITVDYCISGWSGGFDDGTQTAGSGSNIHATPYGGGGGCWGYCDSFIWDHCFIFQQWDSGVSPQYKGSSSPVVTYKDFITTNCVFKGCRWTLEYWLHQAKTTEDVIDHLVFDYNICRDGGYGFNNYSRSDSAYVENWGYPDTCKNNCSISHNIFDRPYAKTYEIGGFLQLTPESTDGTTKATYKFSVDAMPVMQGNIHLQTENKDFALVHKGCEYGNANYDLKYKYNTTSLKKFVNDGFEKDSLFLFASR